MEHHLAHHDNTYEGRPLPRPEEEVVDQGLSFDLGTLMHRRRALQVLGVGLAGTALAACGVNGASDGASTGATGTAAAPAGTATAAGSAAASAAATASSAADLTEVPDETAGPYPGDGSNGADVLTASGVVRADIRSSFGTSTTTAQGVPMTLTLTILDVANGGSAMAGAAVYVWHCDRAGNYSMYSSGVTNENYLRGVQVTDDAGRVTFTSIFPACYSGRWPHIHFEVYPNQGSITDSANAIATSQVALPKAACDAVYATSGYEQSVRNLAGVTLDSDNVFGDDGGIHQLGTVTGDVTSGYGVSLTAPVDTRTAPTAGSAPGGGPGR